MVLPRRNWWGEAEAARQGMAVAPLSLRSQRMGLPRDDRGSQRQTQSSGSAAGLRAGKGLRTPAFCGVRCMSSEGLCTSTEKPLAEMGWPSMVWANGQAGGVPEKYWEDEVLWSTRSLLGELSDWQGVKGGSIQFCYLGAGQLQLWGAGRLRETEVGVVTDKECRITPSALTPQRIGLGVWD